MLTYGDGVADIDISALIRFHKEHNKLATVTAVRPPARFGTMQFDDKQVTQFREKPQPGEDPSIVYGRDFPSIVTQQRLGSGVQEISPPHSTVVPCLLPTTV